MNIDEYGWILMNTNEYWWLLMSIDDYWWILINTDKYWWIWMNMDEYGWILMNIDEYWWIWMNTNEYWWIWMNIDEYWLLVVLFYQKIISFIIFFHTATRKLRCWGLLLYRLQYCILCMALSRNQAHNATDPDFVQLFPELLKPPERCQVDLNGFWPRESKVRWTFLGHPIQSILPLYVFKIQALK